VARWKRSIMGVLFKRLVSRVLLVIMITSGEITSIVALATGIISYRGIVVDPGIINGAVRGPFSIIGALVSNLVLVGRPQE
jgi:hypothetical protein